MDQRIVCSAYSPAQQDCMADIPGEMARIGTKRLGDRGEVAAAAWLVAHGYEVLDRNVRTRFGELTWWSAAVIW
ncbi:MAG: YraN family protein [Armatimonadota bacterium]|nr:YraN family protein [Armatimonadota bacterium]